MNKILPEGVSFTWDFGAPGHGKGVWDGLAGKPLLCVRVRVCVRAWACECIQIEIHLPDVAFNLNVNVGTPHQLRNAEAVAPHPY